MFAMICITGLLPILLSRFKSNPALMSHGLAFSGGLFLSVGLLHLLPEANHHFHEYYESIDPPNEEIEHFPFSYLIMILTFSFILYIERVYMNAHSHSNSDSKNINISKDN